MFAGIWRKFMKRIISPSTSEERKIERAKSALTLFSGKSGGCPTERSDMKRLSFLIVFVFAFACANLFAQGKIDLQTSDTILGILQKNIGQVVELRMKSGEKIAGRLEKLGDKLVKIGRAHV